MVLTTLVILFGLALNARAAEKVRYGTGVRLFPAYYLPPLAAEEKGFWKENGLEAEWVPFKSSADMITGIVSGGLNIGVTTAASFMTAAARGIPIIIVSDLAPDEWVIWVRADSRYKEPKELKGAKLGMARLGGTILAYAHILAKATGLENQIKFLGTGDMVTTVALLKVGVIDLYLQPFSGAVNLKLSGEVREIGNMSDYFPKPWAGHMVLAQKEFARRNPDTVKRVVKAVLQGNDYGRKNQAWAMDKMKSIQGFTEEAARLVFEREVSTLSKDGKIPKKAIENVRNFMLEYNIVDKAKTPAVEDLFTAEFTG